MNHAPLQIPHLLLWLNSGCNARCQICEIWRDTSKTFIPADEVRRMSADWVAMGVTEVELCGEPTIHPQLLGVCEAIRDAGIAIRFLSNGLRLSRYASLIAQFGRSLTVSLDGPPEVHDRIRNVPKAFQKLERGIQAVRTHSPHMPIYGRCATHRLNFRHLRHTVATARALRLSDVSFMGLDATSPAFGRDSLQTHEALGVTGLMVPREELAALQEEVEALIAAEPDAFDSGFIRESADTLRSVLIDFYTEIHEPATRARVIQCSVPWKSAVIEPDGKVRPCWFLPEYGNLSDHPGGLRDLLNTPAAQRYRDSIDIATNPVCRACVCPRTFSNKPRVEESSSHDSASLVPLRTPVPVERDEIR